MSKRKIKLKKFPFKGYLVIDGAHWAAMFLHIILNAIPIENVPDDSSDSDDSWSEVSSETSEESIPDDDATEWNSDDEAAFEELIDQLNPQ